MNNCKENLWMGNTPSNWKLERLQWHLDEINQKNYPVKTSSILSLTNKLGVVPYSEKEIKEMLPRKVLTNINWLIRIQS